MSKRIPLTQGKFATVDDEDYDRLMQWKWCVFKSKGIIKGACRNIRKSMNTKDIEFTEQNIQEIGNGRYFING